MKRTAEGIYLVTENDGKCQIILCDGLGQEQVLPPTSPADRLLEVLEYDYSEYRKEVERLYEHPLFEEKLDISYADLEDLVFNAVTIPSMLKDMDPVSWFVLGVRLHQSLQMRDDGSALFLLQAGMQLIHVLEEPIRTQIRLRNIFEVVFDEMERASQQERYERLNQVYPGLLNQYFISRPLESNESALPFGKRIEYMFHSPFEMYLLELLLYFQQDQQRIARCEYCGKYFVPKTRKETLYCDRAADGATCKKIGPNLKRKVGPEQDQALKIYNQLRARMAERLHRYETAADWQKQRLFQLDILQYSEWMDTAHKARQEYLSGNIPTEDFLRRIDVYHELSSYDAEKLDSVDFLDTPYGQRLQNSIDFDPARAYPDTLMVLDLRKNLSGDCSEDTAQNPTQYGAHWEYPTREDLIRKEREGHDSLRNKYPSSGT